MDDKTPSDRIPLSLQLSPDLAKRLQAAAAAQKRPAAAVVIELLERHLPRPQPGGGTKGKIPYA